MSCARPWQENLDHAFKKINPDHYVAGGIFRSLAMTYSHMGKPHTTIGDAPFHC